MASAPIRIGIVGCGRILPAHLRGYRLLREAGIDSFRITGLTSRHPNDAASFRKRGEGPPPRAPVTDNPADPLGAPHIYVSDFQDDVEARVYGSLEEMLEDGQVDVLQIPAAVNAHHTAALAGLKAGKHCLVEKPLAISVRAGRLMVEEARRRGLTLGVVENVRYREETRVARWIIDQGYLGEPQMALMCSVGATVWAPDRITAETAWRHRKLLAGGGATLDIGVHWLDKLRYLMGEIARVGGVAPVVEKKRYTRRADGTVQAAVDCEVDDAFFATCQFHAGAVAHLSFAFAGHGEGTILPGGLSLYGSRGCLKGDELVLDDGSRQSASTLFWTHASAEARQRYFPYGIKDGFALVALDFLRAVEAGRDPETSGEEGLRDLAASYAICESSALGRTVDLEDVLQGNVATYQAEIDRQYGL